MGHVVFIAFERKRVLLISNARLQTNKKESIANEQQNDEQKLESQGKLLQKKPLQEQLICSLLAPMLSLNFD